MECCYRLKLNQDDDVGNIHSGRIFSSRIWGACACATIVASQCAMPRWMDGGGGNVYMIMVHITKTDVKMLFIRMLVLRFIIFEIIFFHMHFYVSKKNSKIQTFE